MLLFALSEDIFSQCAMCRASIENNANNGVISSSNLNVGILYLLSMPYLAIAIIGYLWYKNTKKRHEKKSKFSYTQR
jgi:hypothetical protein